MVIFQDFAAPFFQNNAFDLQTGRSGQWKAPLASTLQRRRDLGSKRLGDKRDEDKEDHLRVHAAKPIPVNPVAPPHPATILKVAENCMGMDR